MGGFRISLKTILEQKIKQKERELEALKILLEQSSSTQHGKKPLGGIKC